MTALRRLKAKRARGRILLDTLFSLRQRRGDHWYATVTAKWDDPARDPIVAIGGPFDTEDEAREFTASGWS
jgi:hypothetical protein